MSYPRAPCPPIARRCGRPSGPGRRARRAATPGRQRRSRARFRSIRRCRRSVRPGNKSFAARGCRWPRRNRPPLAIWLVRSLPRTPPRPPRRQDQAGGHRTQGPSQLAASAACPLLLAFAVPAYHGYLAPSKGLCWSQGGKATATPTASRNAWAGDDEQWRPASIVPWSFWRRTRPSTTSASTRVTC